MRLKIAENDVNEEKTLSVAGCVLKMIDENEGRFI